MDSAALEMEDFSVWNGGKQEAGIETIIALILRSSASLVGKFVA